MSGSLSNSQSPLDDGQVNVGLLSVAAWDNTYELREGICVMPVALTDAEVGAGMSPILVGRLHPPYRKRTVTYATQKQNNPPIMPTPQSTGAFVFAGGSISLPSPTYNQTLAMFDWKLTSQYHFYENCQSDPADGFVIGTPPFVFPTQGANSGSGGNPSEGAVAQAGQDAKVGFAQGVNAQGAGIQAGIWNYNCQSFYSGVFFNDTMLNAGT